MYETHNIWERINNIILEYSLVIVLGKISPSNKIIAAIGIKINLVDIILIFNKYAVAKEDARILDRLVPTKQTIRKILDSTITKY